MPQYGTIDSLLAYAPRSTYVADQETTPPRQRASIEAFLAEKVRSLSSILEDIEWEARQRQRLSLGVLHQIYLHYTYIKAKLFELYIFPVAGNRAIEMRRSSLEKQLDALNVERRQEQVLCRQDVARLRQEFRNWFKQHADLVQRVQLVLPDRHATLGARKRRIPSTYSFVKGA